MIDCENPNLKDETIKKVIRRSSDLLSRSTYEIDRRNLIWDEKNYEEAMAKGARASLKRKVNDVETKKDDDAAKVIDSDSILLKSF